jgi:alginate O-acetyltransferase complex protein AlgI
MVFNSLTFVVFFAAVFALHSLPLPWTLKKFNLLIASYLFYAAWNPPFVLLLVAAGVIDFYLAQWIGNSDNVLFRRSLLTFSLALNLGLLSLFKYGTFLLENFVSLLALAGITFRAAAPSIILPLGISFYTFETISYLVDVYRRRVRPWPSILDYGLFLAFFPHLVAGPIVRAHDFLPQCLEPKRASSAQLGWGLSLLLLGLFAKVVLADGYLAPVADKVYNAPDAARFADAWLGTLAFAGQIYFDFAGYSLCGIGAALCLGFALNDNFHFPYAAAGFSDFWQRWHISLSSWLRDYLYVPLGGNRRGPGRTYFNLVLTMLLGGLWHGAAWRFVAWGGLHGLYLIGERAVRRSAGPPARGWRLLPAAAVTFLLVCVAWVFFRAQTFGEAFRLLTVMTGPGQGAELVSLRDAAVVLGITTFMLAGQWALRDTTLEQVAARVPWWGRSLVLLFLVLCLVLTRGDDRAFIYFQF